jgi:hypothetical protein
MAKLIATTLGASMMISTLKKKMMKSIVREVGK